MSRVFDLLADLLAPVASADAQGTPANPAKPAKAEHPCGLAADSAPCEGLRISAKAAPDSQPFAGVRKPANPPQSKQRRGFSQDSRLSQGVPGTIASAQARSRPYRLSAAEGDAAHAVAWDDGAIARFVARVALLMRRGIDASDADDLAERLHLRDVQGDDRVLCVECRHLAGRPGAWYCGNSRAAGVGDELSDELTARLQRCGGFDYRLSNPTTKGQP